MPASCRMLIVGMLVLCFVVVMGPPVLDAAENNTRQEIQRQLIAQTDLERQVPKIPEARAPQPAEIRKPELPEERLLSSEDQTPFALSKIRFSGHTAVTKAELEKWAGDFLKGQSQVRLNDVKNLAHEITKQYRALGYVAARAYVPVQTVDHGEVEIKILEGQLRDTIVRGNRYHSKNYYAQKLGLHKDDLLFYPKLRQEVTRLNNADRTVRAYLNPTEDPRYFDTVLDVEESFPVHGFYNFNNYGTNLTHRERHNVTLYHNSLTGHDDRLYGSWTFSEQATVSGWNMGYSFPIPRTGTRLSLLSSIVHSQLGKGYRQYNIRGEYWSLTPGIEQTLWRSSRGKWDGYLNFEIKDSKSTVDRITSSFDRTRVLVGGTRFQFRDRWAFSRFDAAIHQGIPDFLGGSSSEDPHASREGTGGEFTYFTGSLERVQPLPCQLSWTERAEGFLGLSKLITLEQNRMGGSQSIRGYPEADVLGDGGFALNSELSMPVYGLPKTLNLPMIQKTLPLEVRLIGFFDLGKSYLYERDFVEQEQNKLLMSSGFGIRANLGPNVSMVMDMGFPFGDPSTDKDRPQVHMSVNAGI